MVNNVTGIILTGGKSSRMGTDKALLKYGSETFVSHSVKKLQELFDEVIIVADNEKKYDLGNVKLIGDIYPGRGPLGGIHAGLVGAKNDWIFVVPCDMPLWEPLLVNDLAMLRFNYDAVVPKINNNLEPLFALYNKSCLPIIENCLVNNFYKVLDLFPIINTKYLIIHNEDIKTKSYIKSFYNVNTPEQLYNFVKANGLKTDIETEKALEILIENTKTNKTHENVFLSDALGRIMNKDIYAPKSLPEAQRSSVDGYAICEDDIEKIRCDGFVKLKVTEEIAAGSLPFYKVSQGLTSNIMTGTTLPVGTKTVIMHEHIKKEGQCIIVKAPVIRGQNIIDIGIDVKEGCKIAEIGNDIGPSLLSILAFNGFSSIPVYPKVKAAIISTGSELILPGEPHNAGKSYNSNLYLVDSMLKKMGVDTFIGKIVPDNAAKIADSIQAFIEKSDIVISLGGVSAGQYDLMQQSFLMLGAEILFSGIAMRPGKSFIAAKKGNKLFLGLSGSPGSAFNNLQLLVKPVIKKMMGCTDFMPHKIKLEMPFDYINKKSYRKIMQAKLYVEKGKLKFEFLDGDSIFKGLTQINLLIDVPPNANLNVGDFIDAYYIEGMVNI
ncbi:MAG: NTP transferase domain-containing protein [Sedimentibacter sp.]